MSRATPEMRNLARRILASEASLKHKHGATRLPATFAVCEKLRMHLTGLMGSAGFRALLSRSLILSDPEVPWLRTVRTKKDGTLEGLHEIQAEVRADEIARGGLLFLAELLGMLAAFIGADLTMRLMQEAWPDLSIDDLRAENGDKK